jgi:hypothetical protein
MDLWPDGRQRNTRLIEELAQFDGRVREVTAYDPEPGGYFVQSIDPWVDDCLDRRYHQIAVAEGRSNSLFYLDVLPGAAIEGIRKGTAMLVVDGSIEGGAVWPVQSVKAVYDEITAMELPKSRVALVTGNYFMNSRAYREKLEPVEPAASIFLHNSYFSKAARVFSERYREEFENLRDLCLSRAERAGRAVRDYCCLNYLPRPHRIALISLLISDGVFETGFISCSDLNNVMGHKKINTSEEQVRKWLTGFFDAGPGMLAGAEKLRAIGRLVLDEDLIESRLLDYKIPRDAALNSWFSIVTETDMSLEASVYITEKILKPVPFFHPFVVFGSPHSLAYFRSVGFKTFSPFFDESYDEVLDPKERFYRCYTEVRRLISLTPVEKRLLIRGLWPVLEHNARHLLFTVCATIRNRWSKPIMEVMMVAN